RLAEQEQLFIAEQAKFRQASIELARILNIEQGTHIKPDINDLKVKELVDIDKPITEILSIALEKRPDIKKRELEYKAQKDYIGAAFSGFLPRANFFGQYGGTGRVFFHRTKITEVVPDAIRLDDSGNPIVSMVNRSQVDLNNITDVSNVIRGAGKPSLVSLDDSIMANRVLGVTLDWSIGDGLGIPTFAKIKQAKNQADIAKTNYLKLKQDIERDVRSGFLQIQSAQKLLDVAERRVNVATEALHLAKVRLENGVGINTELLIAHEQYAGALSSRVDAIIGYNNAQAEFLYNIGLITPEVIVSSNVNKLNDIGE
ncbi:MAG: outer membrane protein, partial [bacterium]